MAKISGPGTVTRKETIRLAAAKLFRAKGYAATGMRDLAGEVGVEAASLYNHIQSKSELLREICFRIAGEFTRQLEDVERDGAMDSLQRLEKVVRFHVRMWVDRLDEVLVATNENIHLDGEWQEAFQKERRVYVRRLEAVISEGIREGSVRAVEPYVAVLTLMNSVRGIEFWHRTNKNVSAGKLEEDMVELLIAGLRLGS
jgi:AcrR family transcriptional regulator